MRRYDYRNDYKNWTKEQIEKHLPVLVDKILLNLDVCDDLANDYSKRHSYLKSRLTKIKVKK